VPLPEYMQAIENTQVPCEAEDTRGNFNGMIGY